MFSGRVLCKIAILVDVSVSKPFQTFQTSGAVQTLPDVARCGIVTCCGVRNSLRMLEDGQNQCKKMWPMECQNAFRTESSNCRHKECKKIRQIECQNVFQMRAKPENSNKKYQTISQIECLSPSWTESPNTCHKE